MAKHVTCPANVSKQTTLLDGFDIGPPKWRVCGRGLIRSVHEVMNDFEHFDSFLPHPLLLDQACHLYMILVIQNYNCMQKNLLNQGERSISPKTYIYFQ